LLETEFAVGQLEDLLGVAAAGDEPLRSSRVAQRASPFSSSFSASMFLARKSRLFRAGIVILRISAISA
jgi:hypothetical protein